MVKVAEDFRGLPVSKEVKEEILKLVEEEIKRVREIGEKTFNALKAINFEEKESKMILEQLYMKSVIHGRSNLNPF